MKVVDLYHVTLYMMTKGWADEYTEYDHDLIYFPIPKNISKEDGTWLKNKGIEWSDEYDCWVGN